MACQRQAITWTNAGILLIGRLGTNFNEILIEIHIISFKKIHFKMLSGKWWPSCLGLNALMELSSIMIYGVTYSNIYSYNVWAKLGHYGFK